MENKDIVKELSNLFGEFFINEKEYSAMVCPTPVSFSGKDTLAYVVYIYEEELLIAFEYITVDAILENDKAEIERVKLALINKIKRWKNDVIYITVPAGTTEYGGEKFKGLNSDLQYVAINSINLEYLPGTDLEAIKKELLHNLKVKEQEEIEKLLKTQDQVRVVKREILEELQKSGMCIDKYRILIINPIPTKNGYTVYGYESIIIK